MGGPSRAAPVRMLALEALLTFDMAIVMVDRINGLPEGPDKAQALSDLRDALLTHRPILRGVLAAQHQAAQNLDLAQSAPVRVLCSIGKAQPHSNAANAETHNTTSEQPGPSVA